MNKNKEMKDFFDNLAPVWEINEEEYGIRERLIDMIDLKKGSLIADIGCGKGVMFGHLLKTEPRKIIAVDISSEMLKYAKESFSDERITCINEDVLTASLPVLDAALIFNSYPHFIDKRALAKKLAEHIRPDGCIVIAHSCSKKQINGRHKEGSAVKLSVPLRSAQEEAQEFLPYFISEKFVDNDELYFLKMIRLA